jgi:hypothetical protein
MLIEITFGKEKMEFDLVDGVLHVGSGANDEICIAGMPKSLLTLNLLGERLMVTAARAVTIGGVMFPAHIPRLVVAGEKMQLPNGICLKQLKPKGEQHRSFKGTACVLKEMVGNGFTASNSRAATLTCLTGLDTGRCHPVALSETLIGRGDNCAVRIRDRSVSRRHARVVRQRSNDLIEAMPDTNGLFLNGEPVKTATLLQSGDVIELGQSLLRYDGPEKALEADEQAEPTVMVLGDDLVELPPDPPEETKTEPAGPPEPPPVRVRRTAPAKPNPFDLVVLGAGAALVVIGLMVTLSASV